MKERIACIRAEISELANKLAAYPVLQQRMQDTLDDLEKVIQRENLYREFISPLMDSHLKIAEQSSDSLQHRELTERFKAYREEVYKVLGYR